jgi:hypothetical protein
LADNAEGDFKIVAEHLATRLGVTLQTACNVRPACLAGTERSAQESSLCKSAAEVSELAICKNRKQYRPG